MAENLIDIAAQAVGLAKTAGATGSWATATYSRAVDTQVRDGKLEKMQESVSRSLSLEIWADGRYATHRTSDLRADRLAGFINDAVALTRALQPDPDRQMPDPALFANRPTDNLDLVDNTIPALDQAKRQAWCLEMDGPARADSRVISAESWVSDSYGEGASVSSNGFSGAWSGTQVWYGASTTVKDEGDRRPEGSMWGGGRFQSELPAAPEMGKVALFEALRRIGSKKGSSRTGLMVVDPRASARLVSALLNSADARSVQQGRSYYTGKVGQKLVSDKLTLTDLPLLPRGLASRHFDGEGISSKSLPIYEAGVFRNLYVDTYYGRKLGQAPTTGSPSNRVVTPGARSLATIVADVKDGVYITSWLGGNSDPTTGDFSFGIRGHLIENGVVGGPIGEMNVTGNLLTLFSGLVEVGSDTWKYSSTLSPTLVFDGVQFSGA